MSKPTLEAQNTFVYFELSNTSILAPQKVDYKTHYKANKHVISKNVYTVPKITFTGQRVGPYLSSMMNGVRTSKSIPFFHRPRLTCLQYTLGCKPVSAIRSLSDMNDWIFAVHILSSFLVK